MTETTLASSPAEPVSLRARKREQTWNAIHEAASGQAMACERLSDMSVDGIAEEANVSPRTFFNYFATKEDAVIGQKPICIDDTLAEAFTLNPGDDLIEKTTGLLLTVFRSSAPSGGTERRRELMRRHPELLSRGRQHIEGIKDLVQSLVAERLLALPDWHGYDPDDPEVVDAAQIIVLTAGGLMRAVLPKLLKATDPDEETEILHRTIDTFHQVAEVTQ